MSSQPPAKFFVNQGVVTSRTDMLHLLRPLLKQTVTLPLSARTRRRRARHRLGRADRRRRRRHLDLLHAAGDHAQHRFVRAPRVRDPARPAARLHPRPGRRAGHRRVRADRPGRADDLAVRAPSARLRHQRVRPDGAARPRSPRGRVADPEGRAMGPARARSGPCERAAAGRMAAVRARPRVRRASDGRGGRDQVSAEAQPSTHQQPAGGSRRPRRLLQVRRTRDQPRDRGAGGPDDVLRHGLHHLRQRVDPRRRVQARPGRHRRRVGRHGARRRDHDDRDGRRRQLPARPGGRPRDQRHRRLLADRRAA